MRHGLSHTPEYIRWCAMVYRCQSKQNSKNYLRRGIKVCSRWRNSFKNFYEDMGPLPSNKHTLDRIDNNKGYSKNNCRWATHKTQNNNTRQNLKFKYEDQVYTLAELTEISGINRYTLRNRLMKSKWDVQKAITYPIRRKE